MKRGTDLKVKFKLLGKDLGLPSWQVKGLLQSLWDFTSENTQRGDIGRFSDEEIAAGINWEHTGPSEMVVALVQRRWLDRHSVHRLVVHGWREHAEGWVKKRVERAGTGFAEDDPIGAVSPTTADNGRQRRTVASNGRLPVPVPVPGPLPVPGDSQTKIPPRQKRRATIPDDWEPSDHHRELAGNLRVNISEQATRFRNHADATGRLMVNWDAAFNLWLERSTDFGGATAASRKKDPKHVGILG